MNKIKMIYDEFGYVNNAVLGRPSNGFITLLWLIKKAWVWDSLTLIGFDFFAKSAPFSRHARDAVVAVVCDVVAVVVV